jgi:hypothetical protein
MEFLALRAEQIGHEDLNAKRKAVGRVVKRLRGEAEEEREYDEAVDVSETSARGGRMAGGWGGGEWGR